MARIYNSEHYLDKINQSDLQLVIKHGNKVNFAYNSPRPQTL